jgi:hypothetical protein
MHHVDLALKRLPIDLGTGERADGG